MLDKKVIFFTLDLKITSIFETKLRRFLSICKLKKRKSNAFFEIKSLNLYVFGLKITYIKLKNVQLTKIYLSIFFISKINNIFDTLKYLNNKIQFK